MNVRTHHDLAGFIWGICNLLRGPYKRNEYPKVILPMTVLRRFDCLLAPSKARVLAEHQKVNSKPESMVRATIRKVKEYEFHNVSKLEIASLLNASNQLGADLVSHINGFLPNAREIMDRFAFGAQIVRMAEKDIVRMFAKVTGTKPEEVVQ